MEINSGILVSRRGVTRIPLYSVYGMGVVLLQFLWLIFWYGDIMPPGPPPSLYESAFSWVCTLCLWPFVLVALMLGKDPPAILWPFLWIFTGVFWGFAVDRVAKATSKLRAKIGKVSGWIFTKWVVIQLCVAAGGFALWFYVRAARILANPADPENYGTYGNNWGFQTTAFILSRLIPLAFGLVVLLVGEWYIRLIILVRKESDNETTG